MLSRQLLPEHMKLLTMEKRVLGISGFAHESLPKSLAEMDRKLITCLTIRHWARPSGLHGEWGPRTATLGGCIFCIQERRPLPSMRKPRAPPARQRMHHERAARLDRASLRPLQPLACSNTPTGAGQHMCTWADSLVSKATSSATAHKTAPTPALSIRLPTSPLDATQTNFEPNTHGLEDQCWVCPITPEDPQRDRKVRSTSPKSPGEGRPESGQNRPHTSQTWTSTGVAGPRPRMIKAETNRK